MTIEEFKQRYHKYRQPDTPEGRMETLHEVLRANFEGIKGDVAVPFRFPGVGYGILLASSAAKLSLIFPELMEGQ